MNNTELEPLLDEFEIVARNVFVKGWCTTKTEAAQIAVELMKTSWLQGIYYRLVDIRDHIDF